jgi:hypothetical protein
MTIIEIKKEEQIEQDKIYLEIFQNNSPDTDTVKKCSIQFLMLGKPVVFEDVFHRPDSTLLGSRWIKCSYVWGDGSISKADYHSLADMGVTNCPHNNHKLYYIAPENMEEVTKLTIAEFKNLLLKGE